VFILSIVATDMSNKLKIIDQNIRAAIAVPNIPANLQRLTVGGDSDLSNVYLIKHTGKNEHLGNAWEEAVNLRVQKG
jgi:hypothetical protein